MAAYDLQDQEELDNFKRIWHSWGKWLFGALLLAAAVYLGQVIYHNQQNKKSEQAADVLAQIVTKMQANDTAGANKDLIQLQQNYPSTVAAAQGTLMMAGTAFDAARYDEAAKHLQWVRQYNQEPLIQVLASQRLATVKLQQQKYDEALQLLTIKVPPAFEGLMLATQGDVYAAKGDAAKAKELYTQALAKTDKDNPDYPLLEMKQNQ